MSDELSREESNTVRWFSPRAGSSSKHPLSSPFHGGEVDKLRTDTDVVSTMNNPVLSSPVCLIDKKLRKLNITDPSSTNNDNPRDFNTNNNYLDTNRSDFYFTDEDEIALQDALDRSTQHLNGIPCFLLQAYRSYDRKMRNPETLWQRVLAYLCNNGKSSAATKPHVSTTSQPTDAPRDLFDDLLVGINYVIRSTYTEWYAYIGYTYVFD